MAAMSDEKNNNRFVGLITNKSDFKQINNTSKQPTTIITCNTIRPVAILVALKLEAKQKVKPN